MWLPYFGASYMTLQSCGFTMSNSPGHVGRLVVCCCSLVVVTFVVIELNIIVAKLNINVQ